MASRRKGFVVQQVLEQEPVRVVLELVKKVMRAEFVVGGQPLVLRSRRGFVGALLVLRGLRSQTPLARKSGKGFRRVYVAQGGARLLFVHQLVPLL